METKAKPESNGSTTLTEGLRSAPIFSFESQALTIANKIIKANKVMDFNVHRPSRQLKADMHITVVNEIVTYLDPTLKESGKALKPEFSPKLRDLSKSISATDPSVQELSVQVLAVLNECVISSTF